MSFTIKFGKAVNVVGEEYLRLFERAIAAGANPLFQISSIIDPVNGELYCDLKVCFRDFGIYLQLPFSCAILYWSLEDESRRAFRKYVQSKLPTEPDYNFQREFPPTTFSYGMKGSNKKAWEAIYKIIRIEVKNAPKEISEIEKTESGSENQGCTDC